MVSLFMKVVNNDKIMKEVQGGRGEVAAFVWVVGTGLDVYSCGLLVSYTHAVLCYN